MKLERVLVWIIIIIFSVISLSFAVGYFFIETVPTTLFATCLLLDDNTPPRPEHTYGEFPFSLIYEINGERKEIKDTLVIKYEGMGYNEGLGWYNKWDMYYKKAKREPITEIYRELVTGVGHITIFYELGDHEYYMGIDDEDDFFIRFEPGDIVISSPTDTRVITEEELYNTYNIRIIEKSISPPLS